MRQYLGPHRRSQGPQEHDASRDAPATAVRQAISVTRLLRRALLAPVALVLLFEEWGWAPLAALLARIARLPFWAWVELKIAALPPAAALLAFGAPMVTLLPVKLLALYLFSHGKNGIGLTLLVGAKVGGTALMARLFHLTQPALMQIGWFAKWYPRWKAWKDALLEQVRQSALWRAARELKARARLFWRRVRGRRDPGGH